MMNRTGGWLASILMAGGLGMGPAVAAEPALSARVAADVKARPELAAAPVVWYAVPAMSDIMRLPGVYPIDGELGAELKIVAAKDEYEPASFLLMAFKNLDKVELKPSELKSPEGAVIPSDALDLKVVKVWYQNGNGWFSYFSDVGLTLVPELLLNDETLITADPSKQANYARLNEPGGSRQVWISPPRRLDTGFDAFSPAFADAKTLQPVSLAAGVFKQFILTAHAPKDAKPGVYKGRVDLSAGGKTLASIPVALRVLPFELPLPKARFDLSRDFIVTLMGAWPKLSPDHPAFMPILKNLRRHNILHLGPHCGPDTPKEKTAKLVAAMKEAGFETHPIISGNLPWLGEHDGTPLTFDELMGFKRSAVSWKKFYQDNFGHTDAVLGLGDEQGAPWVAKTRPAWRVVHEQGLRVALAGHAFYFYKGGHMLDIYPAAGSPEEADKTRPWNEVGFTSVGFYAGQHNGSENPSFVRRQHGLLGYLSNFSMVNNYEFAYGPWNDLANDLYKPMVLAYPTGAGLVDTLAWEGFREGIDDIRYATRLSQLAQDAIKSGQLDRVYAGRKVLQWFALMKGTEVDLNAVRAEMIEKILALTKLSEPGR